MTCACFICSQNIISVFGDGGAAATFAAKSVCVCVSKMPHSLLGSVSIYIHISFGMMSCWLAVARGAICFFLWFHSDFKSNFDMRSEYWFERPIAIWARASHTHILFFCFLFFFLVAASATAAFRCRRPTHSRNKKSMVGHTYIFIDCLGAWYLVWDINRDIKKKKNNDRANEWIIRRPFECGWATVTHT